MWRSFSEALGEGKDNQDFIVICVGVVVLVFGFWCLLFGFLHLVFGLCFLVFGCLCLVFGVWCLVRPTLVSIPRCSSLVRPQPSDAVRKIWGTISWHHQAGAHMVWYGGVGL